MKTQNTKTTAAERNFNRTIDGWKALGLEVTMEDRADEVLGQTTTARVKAHAYGTTVYISATLRKPNLSRSNRFYCPRTSLRFFNQVWHGRAGRKVSTQTASWYLHKLLKDAATCGNNEWVKLA
jgi:hypothetical protein